MSYKAAKAVIKFKNNLFLQLRDNNIRIHCPNCWAFFGGKLEKKEHPVIGLIRELNEELNYLPDTIEEIYVWYNHQTYTTVHFFLIELDKKYKFNYITEGQMGKWHKISNIPNINVADDVNAYFSKYTNE